MNDLFMPEKVKKRDINYLLDNRVIKEWDEEDDCLVYADYSRIYFKEELHSKPEFIRDRISTVWSLAYHNGRLYDSGSSGIIRNTIGDFTVGERSNRVMSLFSYANKLFDSGDYGKLYTTFENMVVNKRTVYDMCMHEGKLYDITYEGDVFETFDNKKLTNVKASGLSLASHEGNLYAGTGDGVVGVLNDSCFLERNQSVCQLFSFKGVLYDCDDYDNLRDTFSGNIVADFSPTAVCIVPKQLLEEL